MASASFAHPRHATVAAAQERADVDSMGLRELRRIAKEQPGIPVEEAIAILTRAKKRWQKHKDIDFVHLKFDGTRWHARLRDPNTGKDVKRQLPVSLTNEQAEEWAREQNERIRHARGLLPSLREPLASRQPKGFRIEEAFLYVLDKHSNAKGKSRDNQEIEIGLFIAWLSRIHPDVTHWVQITREIWKEYEDDVEKRRQSLAGYNHAFKPLRMASKHLATHRDRIYTDELSVAGLKPSGRKARRCSLTIDQVCALLEWARTQAPHVYVVFAIMALAGLRVLEVISLRWCDIDLEYPLIVVTDVPETLGAQAHRVKTAESARRLPICRLLVGILQEYMNRPVSAPANQEAPFLLSPDGTPWTQAKMTTYIGDRIKKLRSDLKHVDDFPQIFTMRNIRTTFNNLVRFEAKADRPALVVYMGRIPEDITASAYEMYSTPTLQELVTRPWEQYLETKWKHGYDWTRSSSETQQGKAPEAQRLA